MALNIPVNLMAPVAPTAQVPQPFKSGTGDVATIAPTSGGAGARDPSSHGGAGSGLGSGAQDLLFSKMRTTLRTISPPDRAEPKSIVTAQGAGTHSLPAQERQNVPVTRPTELDRFAPPNPLPTAPILLAAAAYAARRGGS